MCGCVAPAIPDFNWSAVSDGEVDKGGCKPGGGSRAASHPTPQAGAALLHGKSPAALGPWALEPLQPPCRPPDCASVLLSMSLAVLLADGFAIVAVKVSGRHTGAPFAPPGVPPVPAEGRRVALEQQLMRVLVEGGRIKEIEVGACCLQF